MDSLYFVDRLQAEVASARHEHHKLVWVVGSSAAERGHVLRAFSSAASAPVLQVGEGLSQSLLEVSASLRAASVEECFADLLDSVEGSPVCLDRLEILFETSLKLYPAELVRGASRHQPLVASWPGRREGDFLTFGPNGHPAHRRLAIKDMECQFLQIDS